MITCVQSQSLVDCLICRIKVFISTHQQTYAVKGSFWQIFIDQLINWWSSSHSESNHFLKCV